MVKKINLIAFLTIIFFLSCNEKNQKKSLSLFELVSPEHSHLDFEDYYKMDGSSLSRNGVSLGYINEDSLIDVCLFSRNKLKLYINKGELKFQELSLGLIDEYCNGSAIEQASLIDINGDGYSDLFLLLNSSDSSKTDAFFINMDGETYELSNKYIANTYGDNRNFTFFDYDNDNDLDLYIGCRPSNKVDILNNIFSFSIYSDSASNTYDSDVLLENKNGIFVEVNKLANIGGNINYPNALIAFDYNLDGFQDLFVANDFLGEDYLYLNNGNKTFRRIDKELFQKGPMASMGVDVIDLNHDGFQDLFVTEMMPKGNYRQKTNTFPFSNDFYNAYATNNILPQYQHNFFYLNNQGESFVDISPFSKTTASEWSWSPLFADLNSDGQVDLFITNGFRYQYNNIDYLLSSLGEEVFTLPDAQPLDINSIDPSSLKAIKEHNFVFKGMGGYMFEESSKEWGLDQKIASHGSAIADLDNDGDLDIIINNSDTSAFLYRNTLESKNPNFKYIKVSFRGTEENSMGLGAKLFVYLGDTCHFYENICFRGYQSNGVAQAHIGLNSNSDIIDSIRVVWPGGEFEVLRNQKTNRMLTVYEKNAAGNYYSSAMKSAKPIFNEVSLPNNSYSHVELPFNDFKRDKVIHRKLSREGPSIAVGDVDKNGMDDFYIGGASGQSGSLFLQKKDGFQKSIKQDMYLFLEAEEVDVKFLDVDNDNDLDLYIASSSNEFKETSEAQLDRLFLNDGKGNFSYSSESLPNINTSTGALSFTDYDKDGDLDLFVGGRIIPENYPLTPKSYLLENNNGIFNIVSDSLAPGLSSIGMVTSSAWNDFDNDGDPDLVLVGEWMSFTIFENSNGRLFKKDLEQITDKTKGWWNVVKIADIDNDGDSDFLLGNHGKNSFFDASEDEPLTLLSNDFDNSGSLDPILFKYIDGVNAPFMNRDVFCKKMPKYNNEYYTFHKYGQANYDNMFTEELRENAFKLEANNLHSVWIENLLESDSFIIHDLPSEAQFAPIYDFELFDYNSDGFIDVICIGNSFSNYYEHGCLDALGGVLLENIEYELTFHRNSGFNIRTDAKSIASLNMNGKSLFLIGSSNAEILFYQEN